MRLDATLPTVYTAEHTIVTAEADLCGNWRAESALVLMQEFAGVHAHQFGCGRPDLLKLGIVWMIAQVHVSFTRWPKLFETVRVTTWPEATATVSSRRFFVFEDALGNQIGTAVSLWILVDVNTRRILPFPKVDLAFPDTGALTPPMDSPAKLRLTLAGEPTVHSRTLLYSDIDVNRHLNNARYAGYVCDLFPPERFEEAHLSALAIRYCAEAAPGETLDMALLEDASGAFEVRGTARSDGRMVFEAAGQWIPNKN